MCSVLCLGNSYLLYLFKYPAWLTSCHLDAQGGVAWGRRGCLGEASLQTFSQSSLICAPPAHFSGALSKARPPGGAEQRGGGPSDPSWAEARGGGLCLNPEPAELGGGWGEDPSFFLLIGTLSLHPHLGPSNASCHLLGLSPVTV